MVLHKLGFIDGFGSRDLVGELAVERATRLGFHRYLREVALLAPAQPIIGRTSS